MVLRAIVAATLLLSGCTGGRSDALVSGRAGASGEAPAAQAHVLLIGIDGTRPDALQLANTPNIDALIAEGAVDWQARVDYLTFSGPNWSSMLNGVWCDKHKVDSNSFPRDNFEQYPHFFARVKQQRPDLVTASLVNWAPINDKILQNQNADHLFRGNDAAVAAEAARLLRKEAQLDVMFVDFDEVDGRGHSCCFDPENLDYLAKIEATDALVGEVVHAMRSRPAYAQENWLVVMTTDHGGTETSHGDDIPEHRTTWYLTSGAAATAIEPGTARVTDMAVTAMAHLGLAFDPAWNLDGVASGIANAPELTRRESPNSCYDNSFEEYGYLFQGLLHQGNEILVTSTLRDAFGLFGVPLPDDLIVTDVTVEELANMAGVSERELFEALMEILPIGELARQAGEMFCHQHDGPLAEEVCH